MATSATQRPEPLDTPVLPLRHVSLPELIGRERKRRRNRTLVLLGIALGVVAIIVGLITATRPRPVPLAARFRTAGVTTGDLVREVRATGQLEAVATVAVGAETSGRIASVEVDFNQQVKAGQVLARFDVKALEAQRAQSSAMALNAKAQVEQARLDVELARRNKSRAEQLFAQKALATNEYENSVTALHVAEARSAAATAMFAAQSALATVASTNVEHAIIRSPIDGVIVTRAIDPGQVVASMLTTPVLFTVAADLRKMEVIAAIDESDIAEVAVGQSAVFTVTAWPGRTFNGTVTEVRIAPRIVQDVVTYGAVVAVDNLDLALKPGMTASVRIRTGQAPASTQVPNTALRFTPPGETASTTPRVWLLQDGALQARAVHPGLSDGEQTQIAADDLPPNAVVLVDLSPEGRKAYAAR